MGLTSRFTAAARGFFGETVSPPGHTLAEANRSGLGEVTRTGYEFGVPMGGTETHERAFAENGTRAVKMGELFQAYMTCPWVSTCADTVARLVTAGGLELVPEDDDTDQHRPPQIQALDQLMRIVNDREDMIQLLRSCVTDLEVFGDAFIEIGRVGGQIAALWALDATTMSVKVDEHGEVSGYLQVLDTGRQAEFLPDEVIHISLDSPRGGVYGVSWVQKSQLTITTWLFAAACLKEYYRRGMPPEIAVDLGKDMKPTERERFRQQYQQRRLGPRNIGQPFMTWQGNPGTPIQPPVKELGEKRIADLQVTMKDARDELISNAGLSPAGVGVIESGNLGGGTGEAQAKATHYGKVLPIQNLLLEKLVFHLLVSEGVVGWRFQFGEVDYRDSKTVEDIRDLRLRNGANTLNRYRAEIGEDPVPGGDDAVLVDRQNIVMWADMPAMSKAMIAGKAGVNAAALTGEGVTPPVDKPPPAVVLPGRSASKAPNLPAGDDDPSLPDDGVKETAPGFRARRLSEAWERSFEDQRRRVNKELAEAS